MSKCDIIAEMMARRERLHSRTLQLQMRMPDGFLLDKSSHARPCI